jgi:hypothetical protein
MITLFNVYDTLVYYILQASQLTLAMPDAIALAVGFSSLPTAAIGGGAWALWRKWNETDRDVKSYLGRTAKLEEQVEAMEPCQCGELRETLREWMNDQGGQLQATVGQLENRLDQHIDDR